MIPSTTDRVPKHTADKINKRIHRETEDRVERCRAAGREAIDRRLAELDREWDIERTLEANAGTVALAGCALGAAVDKRLFVLPVLAGGFLLQHAIQGWCPPVPILRRKGVRTRREIDAEKYALKAVRGDFSNLLATTNAIESAVVAWKAANV
jgi:hypothetical protein